MVMSSGCSCVKRGLPQGTVLTIDIYILYVYGPEQWLLLCEKRIATGHGPEQWLLLCEERIATGHGPDHRHIYSVCLWS